MKAANPVSERRLAIDDLDQAIVTLSARIHAANYELLMLIREFDERAGFLRIDPPADSCLEKYDDSCLRCVGASRSVRCY